MTKRSPKRRGHKRRNTEASKRISTRRFQVRALKSLPVAIAQEPDVSAELAGLHYVTDTRPGIRRVRAGKHFRYLDPHGKPIRERKILDRIQSLAIPPAWTEVWICPLAHGHLQATGRDAKGRKQYRYHPRWREVRDQNKYDRLVAFGKALPRIRERTQQDLQLSGLPRERILATIVRLLEATLIRVGNEEYARNNASFGLTTMRDQHVEVSGAELHFEFRGKSGIQHTVDINDKRLARIVQHCQDLPGEELFQYLDDKGERHPIGSKDVNEYLHDITGEEFTAKDFRTWAGTVLAAQALEEFQEFDSQAQAKKNIVQAIESVAKRLGNTKTICRKCYIHPAVINAYLDGTFIHHLGQRVRKELVHALAELSPEEAAVLAFLQERLKKKEEHPCNGVAACRAAGHAKAPTVRR